jgi:hypothetical protein
MLFNGSDQQVNTQNLLDIDNPNIFRLPQKTSGYFKTKIYNTFYQQWYEIFTNFTPESTSCIASFIFNIFKRSVFDSIPKSQLINREPYSSYTVEKLQSKVKAKLDTYTPSTNLSQYFDLFFPKPSNNPNFNHNFPPTWFWRQAISIFTFHKQEKYIDDIEKRFRQLWSDIEFIPWPNPKRIWTEKKGSL